jgi:hypothetical protein
LRNTARSSARRIFLLPCRPHQNDDSKRRHVETDGIVNPGPLNAAPRAPGTMHSELGLAALAALALLLEPSEWLTLTADLTLPRC